MSQNPIPMIPLVPLREALSHNPRLMREMEQMIGDLHRIASWDDLYEAFSRHGAAQHFAETFNGNKSERLVLAAILTRADYARQAGMISPDFWIAWGGLDIRNRQIVRDILMSFNDF